MKHKLFVLFFFINFLLFSIAFAADAPQVEMFSPQGTVKGVRQVNVRFSEQMVPFGDPRSLIDPFAISCPQHGVSRWADGKNWIYDFEKDIPAGVHCEFKLKPGIKALSGKEVDGQKDFFFSTGGPAIIRSIPYEGSEWIDEEQIFILTLDAEPDMDSIMKNVVFSVDGIQDQIGISLIDGKKKEEILAATHNKKNRKTNNAQPAVLPPTVLIQSKQRFPADTRVSLVWGEGVKSKTGVATEQDQLLHFKTRKEFAAEFHCQRENPQAGCIPFLPVSLNFSAPISQELAKKIVLRVSGKTIRQPQTDKKQSDKVILVGPDKKTWIAELKNNEGEVQFINFNGPFPENADFTIILPPGLKDDAGRKLVNADKFPLAVRTDKYPPLVKFSARFGILEAKANTSLPVTVRNIEPQLKLKSLKVSKDEEGIIGKVMASVYDVKTDRGENLQHWLRKAANSSRNKSIFTDETKLQHLNILKPNGAKAFEVIGIPMKKAGFYIVELESAILGKSLLGSAEPMYVQTAALVTNLSAHFKWGRESSLVWVTRLDKAVPVSGAQVTIGNCEDKIIWNGKTDAAGIARIEQTLPNENELPYCNFIRDENHDYRYDESYSMSGLQRGLFVTAQKDDDLTFVHSSWSEGIEPWRFQLPQETFNDPVIAHTVFDRTLMRAGETVHMKHILRRHTRNGFTFVPQNQLAQVVSIEHSGSGQKYEFPLKCDGNGIAETTWIIPREAKLGNYNVILRAKSEDKEDTLHRRGRFSRSQKGYISGSFNIEEYRVPLMKGTIQQPHTSLIKAKEITLDLGVQYLAGGGAGNIPINLRSQIGPKYISSFEGYDDFIFSNGAVKEGITRRGDYSEYEAEAQDEETNTANKTIKLPAKALVLDAVGTLRTTITKLPQAEVPRELLAEMEYHDPNGEIQTVASRIPIWNSQYLIGIKPDSWAAAKDSFKFHVAVLNIAGKPVAGAPVLVDLLERKNYSHRKRLIGGFYAYEHSVETKKIGVICTGKTNGRGLLICEAKSPVSGNVILQAQSTDKEGRRTIACRDIWIAAKGEWWFDVSNNDRIDLIAEKKRYEPGETAKLQVRMPFREAMALISVEREGIVDTWVKKISGKNPVIEVPVKDNYAPNVFVSALVVRGRAADVKPTSIVDLGKPAYKLGIAEINVGWKNHELKLSLSPDQKVYKIRQKAKVKIKAITAEGKAPPAGSEVAVAVVDEGLLELMPNRSWEILAAMMGRRGTSVKTATAQMQVIGKRHFGLKAVTQGGGGGTEKGPTRELFDTLLLWQGRVSLNATGEAVVDVPLNDSITSFRIVAVATGGAGLFGAGSTSIRSTQDLMLFSGLPPVVREGDKYHAGFTVRNTTDHSMNVQVVAQAQGIKTALKSLSILLASGEAKEIGWDILVPTGLESVQWQVDVKDKATSESDRITVIQKVVPVTRVSTFQATIMQLDKEYRLAVEQPHDAQRGRGGVKTIFKAKLSEGLNGVTDYMKKYPYTCMEQKISIAVALRDPALWKECMAKLPSHLDYSGLVRYFPMSWCCGSATLTSYIISIAHEAGWEIPEATKEKMVKGLKKFIEGRNACSYQFPTADLNIRKLAAIEALSREEEAEAKMLDSITLEPNLWPTSAVIDWMNILQNMEDVPNRDTCLKEAEQIIRSRLNFQGTTMGFSTQGTDCLWWLMVSNDVNAVRVLLTLMNEEKWREDMPRLVQGALGRQKRGHWDLTLANAWGVLAMETFSQKFEAVPVSGISQTQLGAKTKSLNWQTSPKGQAHLLSWPDKKDNLVLSHTGSGKPWVTVQSLAAIPLKKAFSSGYKIKKTIIPVEQKNAGIFSKGDIVRVRLELAAQADQTWVVVSDPIPAGTTILGKGLARDSQILTNGEKREGWVWPVFEERSMEAFRAYYEYVPKGNWTVEYTMRLNQNGIFHLPTTRVEAMYFPEMLGEMPNKTMEVGQ